MLEIKDLTKKYNNRIILDNINFTFKDNKIYGIIGKNGAGKTTFFNILYKIIIDIYFLKVFIIT